MWLPGGSNVLSGNLRQNPPLLISQQRKQLSHLRPRELWMLWAGRQSGCGVGPKKQTLGTCGNPHSCSGALGDRFHLWYTNSGIETCAILLNLPDRSLSFAERRPPVPSLGPQGSGGGARLHLLFEVAPFLLVYQHQVEIVAHGELLVDVPHGGGELVARQEEPDRDGLSCKGQAGIRARDKVATRPYTSHSGQRRETGHLSMAWNAGHCCRLWEAALCCPVMC